MEIIYADVNRIEQGVLINSKADIDIGNTYDFEIEMNLQRHCLEKKYCWYVPFTEYGGIVKGQKVDTKGNRIYYYGNTWRGMLRKKVIEPLPSDAYRIVMGNDTDIISSLLNELSLSSLFEVQGTSSFISYFQFDRYCTLLDGLNKMLKTKNKKLSIKYDNEIKKVVLTIEDIKNYSDEIEFSEDGNIYIKIEDNDTTPTHLICLGAGELAAREVVNLYRDANNVISTTQSYFGINDITEIYDAANAEDLTKDGIAHFTELLSTKAIEVDVSNMDIDLYDIVSAREYITGMYAEKEVTQKVVNINYDGASSITYSTGDKTLI